jgi:signal transduction histidine kinase
VQETSTPPKALAPIDLTVVVGACAVLVTVIGTLVFAGWGLRIPRLLHLPPDSIVMLPNTALGFAAGGLALWFLRRYTQHAAAVRAARVLSGLVLVIGLVSFIERVTGLSTGLTELLFVERLKEYPYRPLGLMATNSTVAMTLAGISLLAMEKETRRQWRPSQLTATLGLAIGSLALVGHVYGARPLYTFDRAAGMALITAVAFVLLHLGLLLARADRGHVSLLTARDLGGVLTRRLLPATILVPLLLGWMFIRGREEALFTREGGIALLVLPTIGVFLALVLRSAVVVRSLDRERQAVLEREARARAEAEQLSRVLQEQTVELEQQSQEATEAAMEAAQSRVEAEAANRAKSEFLAVMGHELRTPLNAIGGYVDLLEMGVRGPLTEPQREDLARIKRSQTHLLGLINEVLNYTRIEAGAMRYDITAISINQMMAAVEPLVAPLLRAKALSFELIRPPSEEQVLADPERVRQIFINLLSNAVKFTPVGGRITLWCEDRGPMLAFRVSDTGIGIPADKTSEIFEPFVQIDARLTRVEQGIGLGLAISRDLARGMGGDLTVESRDGDGSTFTLTLPRVQMANSAAEGPKQPPS